MDFDAFKGDLRKALGRLPKEVLETLPPLLMKYAAVLEPIIPAIVDDLGRHVGAIAIEKVTTGVDVDGLTAAVEEVFKEFGLDDKDKTPTGRAA